MKLQLYLWAVICPISYGACTWHSFSEAVMSLLAFITVVNRQTRRQLLASYTISSASHRHRRSRSRSRSVCSHVGGGGAGGISGGPSGSDNSSHWVT